MRAMPQPTAAAKDVFALCASGITDFSLRQRISAVAPTFVDAAVVYIKAAAVGGLYRLPHNRQRDTEILVGDVTKGEVRKMYSYYLVGQNMPARGIYDGLVASAPGGVCPLCGAGYAVTLDHYLPKAKFPFFAILPQNLVPACRDCNTGKLATFASAMGAQSLHPYFDHGVFVSEQWLVANVVHSSPASIQFSVSPPIGWSEQNKERVLSHFTSLKLASRFAVLAASELSSISALLTSYVCNSGPNAVREYLKACASTEFGLHSNSWKTAMLQALASCDWYCETGFNYK